MKENVVAYINLGRDPSPVSHTTSNSILDSSVSGSRFSIEASPSLADTARDVAISIPHPTDSSRTLWDMRNDRGPFSGPISQSIVELLEGPEVTGSATEIAALGSGSDYTVRQLNLH